MMLSSVGINLGTKTFFFMAKYLLGQQIQKLRSTFVATNNLQMQNLGDVPPQEMLVFHWTS